MGGERKTRPRKGFGMKETDYVSSKLVGHLSHSGLHCFTEGALEKGKRGNLLGTTYAREGNVVSLRPSERNPVQEIKSMIKMKSKIRISTVGYIGLVLFGAILYILNFGVDIRYHIYTLMSDKTLPIMKSDFVVDTIGCRIPDLDPFDPIVQKFINEEKPLKCHEKHQLLVDSNLTSLFIVKSALPFFNISDLDQLDCCYQPFWRYADNCTSFKESVSIQEEFVKVLCSVDSRNIYTNYHAFIPLKPEVEKRCKEARENSSTEEKERVSVLLVGMDAVSRMNFHRQLPKILKILQNMKAIELLGYNKVGDNTFPNLVPVLSGLSEKELKDVCWPNKTPYSMSAIGDHGIRWGVFVKPIRDDWKKDFHLCFLFFLSGSETNILLLVLIYEKIHHHLTTPFDMYETLIDLLNLDQIEMESIQKRSTEFDNSKQKPRGISLFLPVPKSRTCSEAGIEPHWCTCQRSEVLSVEDSIIKKMSSALVEHLNALLKPYGECSQLQVEDIKSASVQFPLQHLYNETKDGGLKDYVIVIQTTPGGALFE
ncbi:hypothetical protein ANN_11578, partial [Periplaneta americana]